MAQAAQDLLAGSGWLPEPLRTPDRDVTATVAEDADDTQPEVAAQLEAPEDEPVVEAEESRDDDEPATFQPTAFAAE